MNSITVKVLVNADGACAAANQLVAIAEELHRIGDAGLCFDEPQTVIVDHELVGLVVCTKNEGQA